MAVAQACSISRRRVRSEATTAAAVTTLAVDHGASWFAAALLGMLTAITGGILRDILANEVPFVMGPDDLYATPAMLGAITYSVVDYLGRSGSPFW